MKIGWTLSQLEPRDTQELKLATSQKSFGKAVGEIRKSHTTITPATTRKLWQRIRDTLRAHPQVHLILSAKLPLPLSRYSQELLDFEIRTSLYYGTGYDWSRGERMVVPDWGNAQRSLARKNFSRPMGMPRYELRLNKKQQQFARDLKAWFVYCSQVSAQDMERLRQSSGLVHLWSVLWLEHLLFNTPLQKLPTVSPRAGFDIEWDEGFLYALIYRNTTKRNIKKASRSPRGKSFLTDAARSVNRLVKLPPPRIINCKEYLKVGPLPSSHASEVLQKIWSKIQREQDHLEGLGDFRDKPYFDRDNEAARLSTQRCQAPEIERRIKASSLPGYSSPEAVRMSLYRHRQRRK